MKINFALISRSLIALLFVVAGIQKIMTFSVMAGFIGSLGVPLPVIATILVIIVEVPVALMFAWGYEVRKTGYILIGFTVLATLLVHKDYFGPDLILVLKNISIIGGIMSTIGCSCSRECGCTGGTCSTCSVKKSK
ncbi:MAG: DoxX family protein [Candidatus Paceibacterota bacterium]|jgi:putative oxidoreductase